MTDPMLTEMRRIALPVAIFVSVISSGYAIAFPFRPNPQDFQQYLNSRGGWNDGKKRTFSGLRNCVDIPEVDMYSCNNGYIKIEDPVKGTIFCELQRVNNIGSAVVFYLEGGVKHGSPFPCKNI